MHGSTSTLASLPQALEIKADKAARACALPPYPLEPSLPTLRDGLRLGVVGAEEIG